MKRKMIRVLIALAVILIILIALVFIFQRKLLYFPTKIDEMTIKQIKTKYPNSELFLKTKDNTKIHTWFIDKKSDTTIIYFGGNGEDVNFTTIGFLDSFNYNIATMSYRSYGLSQGDASEKNIYNDALFLYDYLVDDKNLKNIIIVGRSLGTGVATYLASKRDSKKVILISPYDSILNIAKEQFPFLPVSLILKDKFDAQNYAKTIEKPLLAIYSSIDKVVTQEHSKALIKSWKGNVKVVKRNNYNHNNLLFDATLIKEINNFITCAELDSVLSK